MLDSKSSGRPTVAEAVPFVLPERAIDLSNEPDCSAEELAEMRLTGLRALIRHCLERSPFYARRLAGIDPGTFTERELAEIPPLTKVELREHWDEIVTAPGLSLAACEAHLGRLETPDELLDGHQVFGTSGSTGRRIVFAFRREEWERFADTALRWRARGVLRGFMPFPNTPLAIVCGTAPTHASGAFQRGVPGYDLSFSSVPVTQPLVGIVAKLNELQPRMIVAYSSALLMLAHEALAGRLRIPLESVDVVAEPKPPGLEDAVRKAWGIPVFDLYGATEVGIISGSCGAAPGMHLNEDRLIFECVDEAYGPTPPGKLSSCVLVTPLDHRTLPLIRYELTDRVLLIEEPCPCGSIFHRIGQVEGRTDDVFRYGSGVVIHPHVFRSPLSREPGVVTYQIDQSERGAVVQVVTEGEIDLERLTRRLERALTEVGLSKPRIEVLPVPELRRRGVGEKVRRFNPL
jgi:phenylacetate-CoA ligase